MKLEEQEEALQELQELQGGDENTGDPRVLELLALQQKNQKELNRIYYCIEELTGYIHNFEDKMTEELETQRKKEYTTIKSYFKAVIWILLILMVTFFAYMWGLIGVSF